MGLEEEDNDLRLLNTRTRQGATNRTKRINIDREIAHADYDTFDWAERAERLGQFLVFRVETPITIGVQGDWGSGKSSFINLVETSLGPRQPSVDHDKYKLARHLCHYVCKNETPGKATANAYVLRFDSWTFAQSNYDADELFPLYVTQVIEHYLRADGSIKEENNTFARLKQAGSTVGRLAITAVANIAGDATSEAVHRELTQTPTLMVDMLASFKEDFQYLINTLLKHTQEHYQDRLIIVIDDLDRITPRSAVELTEKIKVLMDVQGIVFVLAADLSIIQDGLRDKFGSDAAMSSGKNYLDKIVKIQYNVPHLEERDLAKLALGYGIFRVTFGFSSDTHPNDVRGHIAIQLLRAFPTIGGNIRNIKRVLNNFEFSAYLYRKKNDTGYNQHMGIPQLAMTILYQYDHDLARRFYHWLVRQQDDMSKLHTLVSLKTTKTSGDGFASYQDFARHELCGNLDYDDEEIQHIGAFFGLLVSEEAYCVKDWLAAFTATSLSPTDDQ